MDEAAFLRHYAAVCETEAFRRPHQPEFAGWLLECAARARAEAIPAQADLFGWGAVPEQQEARNA